ncbi:MAG: beta-N-acetylglucosaminidase, partial [Acidobacteria bacterium]|nr:beta-N-acetylglucosaminidase [Acidobacteriota bacterium]
MTFSRLFVAVALVGATAVVSAQRQPAARPAPAPPAPVPAAALPDALDRAAERWIDETFKKMTLDEKVGQLFMTSTDSMYTPTDTDKFQALADKVKTLKVGGVIVFGGSELVPSVLLNNTYGAVTLGQPLAAASTLNRLQQLSTIPLLTAADFETGVGFRIAGATAFPRVMALGAAADEQLTFESGKIAGQEGRALGIHMNFAPVADVNNNPRNPVINTRAFGEVPTAVAALNAAYMRGLKAGGMLSTLKHFPGHGDTDVDSHIGLPVITHTRERLEAVEFPTFRAGVAAGADAVMVAHIQMPALDPGEFAPATLSRPIISGLLRDEMKFTGLVVTDAMTMDAVSRRMTPGEAAVRAVEAGNDLILQSPDDGQAIAAVKEAVTSGRIPMAQLDASVRRILRTKARLGLHRTKTVALDEVADLVGGRERQ